MKKFRAFFMAIILVVMGILGSPGSVSKAASASFSISVDNSSASVGSTVYVTVSLSTDSWIAATYSLIYDSSVLAPAGNPNGLFEDSQAGTSQTVAFTVIGTGTSSISASGQASVIGNPEETFSISSNTATVSGFETPAPPSTDPVPPSTEPTAPPTVPPTEPSAPAPTEPSAPAPSDNPDDALAESIDESIRQSEIEAESIRNSIAAAEAASREESLRAQEAAEESAQEAAEETASEESAGETFPEETQDAVAVLSSMLVNGKAPTSDGQSLDLVSSLEGVAIPEGYEISRISIDGTVYEVAESENGLVLYYLSNGTNSDFYLFDEDARVFYPFVTVTWEEEVYVILRPGENIRIPGDLESAILSIDEKPVSAWQAADTQDSTVFVVFAADSQGQRGFYRYDTSDGSMISYSASDTDTAVTSSSAAASSTAQRTGNDGGSVLTILIGLGCVIVLLFIALIAVLVLRSRSKKSEQFEDGEEDEDYDDYDDYDEDSGFIDQSLIPDDTSLTSDEQDLQDFSDQEPLATANADDENRQEDGMDSSTSESAQPAKGPSDFSDDSMIDLEALSKALSDIAPAAPSEKSQQTNTQKLDMLSRELEQEQKNSPKEPLSDDDFEITEFDD